jgi:glycosyltransferase involved in cell wall biosynthesis
MRRKVNISILTSLPSPYRVPIWNKLAEEYNLKLFFTNGEVNQRGWVIPQNTKWQFHFFSKKIFYLGEAQIIPSPFGFYRVSKDADIVIIGGGWEVPLHVATMVYSRITRKKVFIISESTLNSHRFNGRFFAFLRATTYNIANKVLSVGELATESLVKNGVSPDKIIELFNPIDVQFFYNTSQKSSPDSRSGHCYLCVGRLIPLKNFENTIIAFSEVANSEDSLIIVGVGYLQPSLEKLVHSLNLEDRISFLGEKSQSELAQIYSSCATLVMASTNEVWGMVASEALASGCHVVASSVSGISSLIRDMQGVYICETTVSSIAEMMKLSRTEYLGRIVNPEILQFSPEKYVDRLVGIFSS